MSDQVFPSNLRGVSIEVERSTEYQTVILTSASGKEQRVQYQTVPRYRYRLRFHTLRQDKACPAPNAAYTETAIIQKFHDDHRGSWDSFLYDDPYSGSQVRVRFASDTLTFRRIVDRAWMIERLEMVQVL